MKANVIRLARELSYKFPFLRPIMEKFYNFFFLRPKFSGWGMKTAHELPWNDEYNWEIFRKTSKDIKKLEFSKDITGIDHNNIDSLLWRHWIVAYAVRHAMKFTETNNYNFVECGVADGYSAFFALREIEGQHLNSKFSMHLYDSWQPMKKDKLLKTELGSIGNYANLNIERTKRNLAEFKNVVFHQGYIPETFTMQPDAPSSIVYLHIDLNSAKPTSDALNFFLPRLVNGGVILFDDYGWIAYNDTKKVIDSFFQESDGMLLKLPTGQAIYYKHR